jgi:hypothetical protein
VNLGEPRQVIESLDTDPSALIVFVPAISGPRWCHGDPGVQADRRVRGQGRQANLVSADGRHPNRDDGNNARTMSCTNSWQSNSSKDFRVREAGRADTALTAVGFPGRNLSLQTGHQEFFMVHDSVRARSARRLPASRKVGALRARVKKLISAGTSRWLDDAAVLAVLVVMTPTRPCRGRHPRRCRSRAEIAAPRGDQAPSTRERFYGSELLFSCGAAGGAAGNRTRFPTRQYAF